MDEKLTMKTNGKRTETEVLLLCQGVTKKFGALAAVNNLSFEVKAGQVLGIGGPNGAGKTALFDTISGVNPCTSGKITFDGVRIEKMNADEICHRGLSRTFQMNAGFDTLTVAENMKISSYFGSSKITIPGFSFGKQTNHRVDEILEFVGLQDYAKTTVRNLPVFQRKLLMIGSALAADPKLLLLDEPVGGLTPSEIDKVLDLIEQTSKRGVSIILIEHVMRFLMHLSDEVLILHRGELLYDGLPSGVLTNQKVIEVYLGERTAKSLQSQMV